MVLVVALLNAEYVNGVQVAQFRGNNALLSDIQEAARRLNGTKVIPRGTSIIDLDIYPPPTLVIEVANTSLLDDKGEKRLLYEAMNVSEYWIVDVQNLEIIAFAVANGGSRKINQSQVLPGLATSLLEEALQRSCQTNQGQVYPWLLKEFQQK
ncbi:MAG: Uma2 family endonuclease [Okeania sp. SIO2C2]|uniref:Uma2 family endonuclease n=1 Tax=Okeania sp. SIO2C2 TaxID=2607787 RepID=UPI0013BE18FA|nr:Uma2 family endonuclease [Okeania sp. SIO2C2]NEP87617.1 Uma2 family endonuclease [Okeania sp. SIO2C2]